MLPRRNMAPSKADGQSLILLKNFRKISIYYIFLQQNRRMGCGVAMTVLQTRDLISMENANKASKSNLKTNHNIIKANISQPSNSCIQGNLQQTTIIKETKKQIAQTTSIKKNQIQNQKQKNSMEQKKVQKVEPPLKKQQKPKQNISYGKPTPLHAMPIEGKSQQIPSMQKNQSPKPSSTIQKNANIQRQGKRQQQAKAQKVQLKPTTANHPPPTNPSVQTLKKDQKIEPKQLQISKKPQINNPSQAQAKIIENQKLQNFKKQQINKFEQTEAKNPPSLIKEPAKQPAQPNNPPQIKQTKDINQKQQVNPSIVPPEKIETAPKISQQNSKPVAPVQANQEPKKTEPNSKTQFIQIEAINRNSSPLSNNRNNVSRLNLDKKESSKNLNKDVSRKSLKVKKGMVPLDSLFLQSIITKPEEPEIQKQNVVSPQVLPESKQDVSLNLHQGRKSKNEPIQIVDNLNEIENNLEKSNIQTSFRKLGTAKRDSTKITEENIARITASRKRLDEQKKADQLKKKAEQQKRKAEQLKRIQQAKKKLQMEQKKNIEMEANKLKKVYNV